MMSLHPFHTRLSLELRCLCSDNYCPYSRPASRSTGSSLQAQCLHHTHERLRELGHLGFLPSWSHYPQPSQLSFSVATHKPDPALNPRPTLSMGPAEGAAGEVVAWLSVHYAVEMPPLLSPLSLLSAVKRFLWVASYFSEAIRSACCLPRSTSTTCFSRASVLSSQAALWGHPRLPRFPL